MSMDDVTKELKANMSKQRRYAFEYGYRVCEKGHNFEKAIEIFNKNEELIQKDIKSYHSEILTPPNGPRMKKGQ